MPKSAKQKILLTWVRQTLTPSMLLTLKARHLGFLLKRCLNTLPLSLQRKANYDPAGLHQLRIVTGGKFWQHAEAHRWGCGSTFGRSPSLCQVPPLQRCLHDIVCSKTQRSHPTWRPVYPLRSLSALRLLNETFASRWSSCRAVIQGKRSTEVIQGPRGCKDIFGR